MTTKWAVLSMSILLAGCPERSRITGPNNGIGIGPEVTITDPAQDVTMTAGSAFFLKGTAFDEEGVDTIFVGTVGSPGRIPPHPGGGAVQVTFSIPVELVGVAGDTVIITVYAANLQHVRGDLVTRRIQLR